ncbi:hypothetical protein VTJ83DRAFT_2095 [Remersonia thermophila]|uniref:Uncharacterized protein n=1 Tax=Remersonia thermophila TaxID=72144 RepID=A0ABR4DHQ9_9PEZI
MTTVGQPSHLSEPLEPLDVVVETPTSPSSSLARSRFEFETDKRNEGTKILMIEWESPSQGGEGELKGGDSVRDWEVSWEGKGPVLPVKDVDPGAGEGLHRLYFLLPPGAPIPALINIARKSGSSGGVDGGTETVLRTKPMPAIFPEELTSKQDAGRRGVLHTIWAKKRLAEIQSEIEAEMRTNGESVGLEMAIQERQWVIDHFGLTPDPESRQPAKLYIPQDTPAPTSPRSPVGGRLGEKLKGLKLATSPAELAAASQAARDVKAAKAAPSITSISPPTTGQAPPSGGIASLNAIVGSGATPADTKKTDNGDDGTEEDLFALPMSPRSPEMKRSPFSML